jgi:ATP-dependent Clp protease ATP-binding subunit ClpC
MDAPGPRHSNALLIAWRLAELEAGHLKTSVLEPEHFLLGLLKLPELEVSEILSQRTALNDQEIQSEAEWTERLSHCFRDAGLDTTRTRRRLRGHLVPGEEENTSQRQFRRSSLMRGTFSRADSLASEHGSTVLEPIHLLAALLECDRSEIRAVMELQGCPTETLQDHVAAVLAEFAGTEPGAASPPRVKQKPSPATRVRKTTGIIDALGRDLTELARNQKLPPVIGRKAEMRSIVQVLLRSRKNNVILTGEPGVGKTGVVEGLAQRIVDQQVPEEFLGKRIVEISMGSLMAGTNLRGDLEARLQSLISESGIDLNLILFIDEIHLLVGAGNGSGSSMDAANLLKPALARGEIRVIGATTTREYRRMMEKDPALARRFEVVDISEPSFEESIEILRGLRLDMQSHHHVEIDDSALDAAVALTVRHLPAQRLPDKAIDVLDQACAQARMLTLSGNLREMVAKGLRITAKEVAAAVAHRCKVPVGDLDTDDSGRLLNLEDRLTNRVVGQVDAIRTVSEAIRVARSGLRRSDSPLAGFLFVGPSGVGKTELAKALAETVFGDEERHLIRMDMSEFMEAHSVAKMIGAPPGFIGHEQGGNLTEQVRSKPSSVVLLDEVEKAHPRILDLFLQVLDSGFLTDSHGVRVDFRNTIVVMTSNLGAHAERAKIGFGADRQSSGIENTNEDSIQKEVERFFRPEFLNRLSAVMTFRSLQPNDLRQILDLHLVRLNENLKSKGTHLNLTEAATETLVEMARHGKAGARDLERAFQLHVVVPLSGMIMGRKMQDRLFLLDLGTKKGLLEIQDVTKH